MAGKIKQQGKKQKTKNRPLTANEAIKDSEWIGKEREKNGLEKKQNSL